MNSPTGTSKNALLIFGTLSISGKQSAAQLSQSFGLSQPTVSRAIAEIAQLSGVELISHRDGRSVVYAIGRSIQSLPIHLPIYQSVADDFSLAGFLISLHGGGFVFRDNKGSTSLFDGLPWFLQDIRPQGYWGRAFCRAHAINLGLSENLNEWSDEDAIFALAMHGHDVLGNLIIGDRSLAAIMPTGRADSTRYDELAELSLSGETAGSSAGGEHPKFVSGNCIVKFSPLLDGSSVATRWSDLLVAEHCSTVVMSDHGILAPVTRIIQSDVRTHLESDRYDRAGTIGRLAVVSMGAIDDEFVGSRRSWATTANLMLKNKMLAEDVASKIDTIQQFGVLIGNSDMHFGNLSFFFEGLIRPELRLAPIYDMLPMRYAPEKGELVDRGDPVIESDNQLSIALPAAIEMAAAFWTSVANHALISDDFREVADRNLSRLNAAYGAQVMRV